MYKFIISFNSLSLPHFTKNLTLRPEGLHNLPQVTLASGMGYVPAA